MGSSSLPDVEKTPEPIVPFGSPRHEESLPLPLLPADYTITCDQPTIVCGVDMSLFDQQSNEPIIDGNCESNGIYTICYFSHPLFSGHPASSLSSLLSSMPYDHIVDTDTFPSLFDQSFSDEQPISLFFPTVDDYNSPDTLQKTDGFSDSVGVETNLSNSRAMSYWHAGLTVNEQANNTLPKDRTESFSTTIPSSGIEKAKKIARLETLKQQKAHLKEHIQFL